MATPELVWKEPIDLVAGRTEDFKVSLYKTNKKALALAAGDIVRVKVCRSPSDDEPLLELSDVATENGSIVTITGLGVDEQTPATVNLRIGQADTEGWSAGDYFAEVIVVDDSETNPADAAKVAGRGIVRVKASPGGELGL